MSTLYLTLLIFFNIIIIFFTIYTIYANIHGAPYVPTRKKHIRTMLDISESSKGMTLIDLGSGDGRIVCMAAKRGVTATGIEINPILHYWASAKKLFSRHKKYMSFRRENLWHVDLSDVDVLTLFFIKPKMGELMKKIQTEMKPGSCVVSHIFTFDGWQHEKKRGTIFLYRVK